MGKKYYEKSFVFLYINHFMGGLVFEFGQRQLFDQPMLIYFNRNIMITEMLAILSVKLSN